MTLRDRQTQALSLIGPHLDDPKEAFYDPQTKQLKPMFAWYLIAMQELKTDSCGIVWRRTKPC